MKLRFHALLALAAPWAAACASSPTAIVDDPERITDPMLAGRTYTTWFYQGRVDDLWPRFTPGMQRAFGGPSGVLAFREQVRAQAGTEREVHDERLINWLGTTLYARTAAFTGTPRPMLVQWYVEPDGDAAGFLVTAAEAPAESRHLDYQTRTPLRLPFDLPAFVFWGGRSTVENYHAAARDQRFAYDLVIARGAATHSGDAARNESYHCFGAPVLAPGDGTVAARMDGIADNVPGVMNAAQPLGNHVVLDHGNGEYSFLAHLKRGSLAVQQGQAVRAGDVIGQCGNSGNSSEPHLHYHLQTTPVFGQGEGLPAQFIAYLADGRPVARGEPTRGQTVAPAP